MTYKNMKFSSFFSDITSSGKDSEKVVGIDIGSSSIKIVEVQEKKGVLTLTTYGEIQLGPYVNQEIGQSVILDVKKEQQALVDVLRESASKAKSAVFAMPLTSSFVTMMNFHLEGGEDLASKVRVEARKYIPIPIGEVTLDWAEVESGIDSEPNEKSVLVAAIQNQALSRFRTLVQFANFKEPPTEIECFSSVRGVYDEDEEDIAVIDIGAVSTKLYIAHKGLLVRMHRVRVGGVLATKKIAESLNISFDEAELRKRNTKREDSDFRDIEDAHHNSFDRSWREFRQVIKEYENNTGHKVEKVYLTGGGSIFPTVKSLISDTLRKDIVKVNTFNRVAYPAFMEDILYELNPTFHTALGAALRVFE